MPTDFPTVAPEDDGQRVVERLRRHLVYLGLTLIDRPSASTVALRPMSRIG